MYDVHGSPTMNLYDVHRTLYKVLHANYAYRYTHTGSSPTMYMVPCTMYYVHIVQLHSIINRAGEKRESH